MIEFNTSEIIKKISQDLNIVSLDKLTMFKIKLLKVLTSYINK
jgi:hypothetical protein